MDSIDDPHAHSRAPSREAVGHRTVTADTVATFAGLTGDYARIHVDHTLGAASPYGRGFAHGLLGASFALGAMTLYQPDRLRLGDPGVAPLAFAVRFDDVLRFDDTIAVHASPALDVGPPWRSATGETAAGFTVSNQAGAPLTRGHLVTGPARPIAAAAPWAPDAAPALPSRGRLGAEEIFRNGPRGVARVRTITESDVVGFCNFTGDLNPLYLDTVFAARTPIGSRAAPPMLCFCLAFGSWLREFLRMPMAGGEMNAGHLGDRWSSHAPVRWGDTLDVHFRPERLRPTRSDPSRAVLTYALRLSNQRHEVVQSAEVDLMLATSGA